MRVYFITTLLTTITMITTVPRKSSLFVKHYKFVLMKKREKEKKKIQK